MGRDRIRRGSPEAERLAAVERVRLEAAEAQRQRRDQLGRALLLALATGGEAAYALWQARRAELVASGLLGADVVITPSAWTPQPAPPPYVEPLALPSTAVEAARVATELLMARPRLTREEHAALGVYAVRLRHFHQELGWEE
ncbi:hypothetical protein [Deinococcus rufus]|uniref:Uncharacterized protein n=1 Tax=Deinococcus rufus TaxID=2136097 RepID=A0ABV7ZAZ6_9DEIO